MAQELQLRLQSIIASVSGNIAVYARHLVSEQIVAIKSDQVLPTMSAGKTFILLAYAEQMARGKIDAQHRIILRSEDILPGTGALRYCAPGLMPTLSDLAYFMIAFSDNVATNLLLDAIGGVSVVNAFIERFKLSGAHLESPVMQGAFAIASPRALAEAYTVLAQSEQSGYHPQAAELAKTILRRHQDTDGLSRYLPWNTNAVDFGFDLPLTVYSKSGQFPGTQVEAGLYVTARDSYVLAVMCTDLPDMQNNSAGTGSNLLADIGRLVYEAWQ